MSLLEKVYDTFLENPLETIGEQVKEKSIIALPYIFTGLFIVLGGLVIFRRIGR
tara:strand:+ start:134 stop:295 length:162 start_codon:yes stop_codon:yes gene_type:complete